MVLDAFFRRASETSDPGDAASAARTRLRAQPQRLVRGRHREAVYAGAAVLVVLSESGMSMPRIGEADVAPSRRCTTSSTASRPPGRWCATPRGTSATSSRTCRGSLPGYRVKVLEGTHCSDGASPAGVAQPPRDREARRWCYDPAVEMARCLPVRRRCTKNGPCWARWWPTVQAGDLWIMDRNFSSEHVCRYHKGLRGAGAAVAIVEVLMAPRPGEDADDVRIYRRSGSNSAVRPAAATRPCSAALSKSWGSKSRTVSAAVDD